MDICVGVFFYILYCFIIYSIIFALSSQTEAGSAGEQPARDSLMTDENINSGLLFSSPLIFFEVIMP
jgi:hypothetical protein